MKALHTLVFMAVTLSAAAAETPHTVTLEVREMTCATCPLTVRQVLKRQPGVIDATVDLATAKARVTIDAARAQPQQLARAVTDAGFPARVLP